VRLRTKLFDVQKAAVSNYQLRFLWKYRCPKDTFLVKYITLMNKCWKNALEVWQSVGMYHLEVVDQSCSSYTTGLFEHLRCYDPLIILTQKRQVRRV